MTVDRLYHFTCEHGFGAIGKRGTLRPQSPHPWSGCEVIWLTSVPWPDRAATGLTMETISCDRMRYRYIVSDLSDCRPWVGSPEREAGRGRDVADLERFGDPEHWWITSGPVPARLG